ncbi:hypothetical protein FPHYL_6543 [Fusarium phyllophilum]|uniref:Uncharacterized protein n=1 Tax=Fusarium phyllophilum TaxID=47803 RepID=A0A8H5JTY4_9HYPO|nr:hypothetical protein FPHYL_6543 [Fusarium phyllophilum]
MKPRADILSSAMKKKAGFTNNASQPPNNITSLLSRIKLAKSYIWGTINAAGGGNGHTHDWENVVVFVQGEDVKRVAPSCHGGYEHATNTPRLDGQRAKVVYHKDGGFTHCWRMANEGDVDIENYTGQWFIGNLVGWDNWPVVNGRSLRDYLYDAWNGGVGPKFWDKDDSFTKKLGEAAGDQCPGFDPAKDE